MCRLMCYVGPPVLVADVVLWPERSIIKQSYDAQERIDDSTLPMHLARGSLNGDGFGIGWFCYEGEGDVKDPSPCVFTAVTPAWNNENLGRLSTKIVSPLVMAHVRAAFPGMPVSEQNCHPFQWGTYMWMHNGNIGGFMGIRRRLLSTLSDAAYNSVQSFHSDSAVAFALFLNQLPSMEERQPPSVLMQAMEATLNVIMAEKRKAGVTESSRLNFVMSDGVTVVACRYVWPHGEVAASMYYNEGTAFQRVRSSSTRAVASSNCARSSSVKDEGEYVVLPCLRGPQCVLIASEPITNSRSDWVEFPSNAVMVVSQEKQGFFNVLLSQLQVDDGKGNECPRRAPPLLKQENNLARLDSIAAASTATARPWSAGRAGLEGAAVNLVTSKPLGLPPSGRTPPTQVADQRMTGHHDSVMCMQVLGGTLYSGGFDGTIKVWNLDDCRCLRSVPAHVKPVRQLAIQQGLLYSTACQKSRVWDLSDMACLRVLQAPRRSGHQWALAVGPDGSVYTAGQDMCIKRYGPHFDGSIHEPVSPRVALDPNHHVLDSLEAAVPDATSTPETSHCCAVNALTVCQGYLCSAGGDAAIHVWQLGTLQHVATLHGHRGSILTLCSLGNLLLSGGRDNVVRVWDMEALVCRRTLTGHKNDVLCINTMARSTGLATIGSAMPVLSPSGPSMQALKESADDLDADKAASPLWSLVASSSADGSVRVWSTICWSCLAVLTEQPRDIPSPAKGASRLGTSKQGPFALLCVALNQECIVAGSTDGTILMWSAEAICARVQGESSKAAAAQGDGCAMLEQAMSSDDSSLTQNVTQNADTEGEAGPCSKRPRLTSSESNASMLDGMQRLDVTLATAPADGNKLTGRVDREMERSLRELVRIRSVSQDKGLREESFRAAKYLARLLESLGAEMKMVQPADDINPLVLGRLGRDVSKPTVTFYGHYDVQPAMEAGWRTNPFEVTAVDGYLYGRGTSDNKGPILAFLYAVKELREELRGNLPVNVAFVFEGEEENGSAGFKGVVQQHSSWFEGTKLVVISNTTWVGENVPCLTYGMRGMIALSIEVAGPDRDLHSGNEGGVFNEPLADLTKVLASLVDSHNNVMVPHFHEDVRPSMLDPALPRLEANPAEFSLAGYKDVLGVADLTAGRSVRDLLHARWCSPVLSVVDVRVGEGSGESNVGHSSCYRFGPTRFSVIPHRAVGKVSVRFVPNQRAEKLIECLRLHVDHEFAKLRSCNRVAVQVHNVGEWWEADPASQLVSAVQGVIEETWGVAPLLVREGGTMPVASLLERLLNAPAMLIPMGQSSDNYHLANERLRRTNLVKGKNVIKRLLMRVADVFPTTSQK